MKSIPVLLKSLKIPSLSFLHTDKKARSVKERRLKYFHVPVSYSARCRDVVSLNEFYLNIITGILNPLNFKTLLVG